MKKTLFLLLSFFVVFYISSSCSKNSSEEPKPVETQPTKTSTIYYSYTNTSTCTNTSTATITPTHTNTSTPLTVQIKCYGTPTFCTNIYDTVIIENSSNNYGAFSGLSLGFDGRYKRRILIKFDLSSIPSTAQIIEAKLFFYVYDFSYASSNPFRVSAYQINSNWGEMTETWNTHNGGDFGTDIKGNASINSTGSWAMLLDQILVQGWVNGTIPNYGILLKQQTENTVTDYISIFMKEYSVDEYRPYLEVKYIN